MRYKVMFDYSIPQYTDIEVDADNVDEAEDKAKDIFDELYPEAIPPIDVVKVESIV